MKGPAPGSKVFFIYRQELWIGKVRDELPGHRLRLHSYYKNRPVDFSVPKRICRSSFDAAWAEYRRRFPGRIPDGETLFEISQYLDSIG